MTFAFDLFMITLFCMFAFFSSIGNKARLSDIQKELSKIQKKLEDN